MPATSVDERRPLGAETTFDGCSRCGKGVEEEDLVANERANNVGSDGKNADTVWNRRVVRSLADAHPCKPSKRHGERRIAAEGERIGKTAVPIPNLSVGGCLHQSRRDLFASAVYAGRRVRHRLSGQTRDNMSQSFPRIRSSLPVGSGNADRDGSAYGGA